jgi:uncharacterized membrane protein
MGFWDDYKKEPVAVAHPADLEANKIFAILSYFGILFFLPLVCCKDSPYGRFHANQGLILLIATAVAGVAAGFVNSVLRFIPFFGWLAAGLLGAAVGLCGLALMIIGILNAANGEFRRLPFIGKFDLIT